MTLDVLATEHGLIRVFAVNRAPSDISGLLKSTDAATLAGDWLGCPIAPGGAELFEVADLSGVGLAGYLAQGYAVPAAQIGPMEAKLAALDGYVLLVFSSGFGGVAQTLSPGADLTWIGTFGERAPDMTPKPLASEAAQPYTGVAPDKAQPAPKTRAGGSLVVAVLATLAALVLWLALR